MKRALLAIAVFLCIQFLASQASLLYMMAQTGKMELDIPSLAIPMGISLLVGNMALVLVFMFYQYYRHSLSNDIHDTVKNKCKVKPTAWAILSLLTLSIAESLLLAPFDIDDAQIEALFSTMISSPWCIINLCIIGPIAEEIIFRWGILGGFYKRTNKRWLSILIASISFAVIHGNLLQGIPALISGVALGVIYVKSSSLFPCIIAHIMNNALAIAFMQIPFIEEQFTQIGIPLQIIIGTILCSCTVYAISKIHN